MRVSTFVSTEVLNTQIGRHDIIVNTHKSSLLLLLQLLFYMHFFRIKTVANIHGRWIKVGFMVMFSRHHGNGIIDGDNSSRAPSGSGKATPIRSGIFGAHNGINVSIGIKEELEQSRSTDFAHEHNCNRQSIESIDFHSKEQKEEEVCSSRIVNNVHGVGIEITLVVMFALLSEENCVAHRGATGKTL